MKNELTILAIDTSCDDTAIAVLRARNGKRASFNILSNIVSSQIKIHKKWGGVYPTLAKREHQKNLKPVLEKALKKAKNPKIDLIAVTNGPGLEPCLWQGINFAKTLADSWKIPLISVNHIKAHIFVNTLKYGQLTKEDFPALCLVVSGGHTLLFLMEDFGKYKVVGETRDDAAGECFDKTARILGLPYPGGPAIAAAAAMGKIYPVKFPSRFQRDGTGRAGFNRVKLPRPMIGQKNSDFSFSGLKTAVLYDFRNRPKSERKSKNYISAMAAEIQQSIIDVLIKKTIKAAKDFKAKTIILGGGVAANDELRKQFIKNCKLKIENCTLLVPPKNLCTDNAAMTAITGYFRWKNGQRENWKNLTAKANLKI